MKEYLINKTDKVAIDTNVLVYAYQNEDLLLKDISIEILKVDNLYVSHFAFIEFLHIIKFRKMTKIDVLGFGNNILEIIRLNDCNKETYNLAYFLIKRYDCSLPDSIIIADAIINNCDILYSRDMQHNQIYEKRTRIINPYKHSP